MNRIEYITDIIDHYDTSEEAAIAICDVIAGVEQAKDAVVRDREDTIRHLARQ